jgi:hypothetical protein
VGRVDPSALSARTIAAPARDGRRPCVRRRSPPVPRIAPLPRRTSHDLPRPACPFVRPTVPRLRPCAALAHRTACPPGARFPSAGGGRAEIRSCGGWLEWRLAPDIETVRDRQDDDNMGACLSPFHFREEEACKYDQPQPYYLVLVPRSTVAPHSLGYRHADAQRVVHWEPPTPFL